MQGVTLPIQSSPSTPTRSGTPNRSNSRLLSSEANLNHSPLASRHESASSAATLAREEIMALVATLQSQNQGLLEDMRLLRGILTGSRDRDLAILLDEKSLAEKRADELKRKWLEEKRKHQQTKRKLKSLQKALDQTVKANDELKSRTATSSSTSSSSSSSSSTSSGSSSKLTVISEFRK
jgi:hypothetical protein